MFTRGYRANRHTFWQSAADHFRWSNETIGGAPGKSLSWGLHILSGKHHKFSWVNQLFLWPFSIAMLNYQRVRWKHLTKSRVDQPWMNIKIHNPWSSKTNDCGIWQLSRNILGYPKLTEVIWKESIFPSQLGPRNTVRVLNAPAVNLTLPCRRGAHGWVLENWNETFQFSEIS